MGGIAGDLNLSGPTRGSRVPLVVTRSCACTRLACDAATHPRAGTPSQHGRSAGVWGVALCGSACPVNTVTAAQKTSGVIDGAHAFMQEAGSGGARGGGDAHAAHSSIPGQLCAGGVRGGRCWSASQPLPPTLVRPSFVYASVPSNRASTDFVLHFLWISVLTNTLQCFNIADIFLPTFSQAPKLLQADG